MVLYKFVKTSIQQVPGYEEPEPKKFTKNLEKDVIISPMDVIEENGGSFIYDMEDNVFYPTKVNRKTVFQKTVCVDSFVVDRCKAGLPILNNLIEKKEIARLGIGEHILLTMEFSTENTGTIYVGVTKVDDNYNVVIPHGYIVYRNHRNNYANTFITDTTFSTVLTNGVVDLQKVVEAKNQDNISTLSAGFYDYITDTMVGYEDKKPTGKVASATSKKQTKYTDAIMKHHPSVVQNDKGFPSYKKRADGTYVYDYAMNYVTNKKLYDMSSLWKNQNRDVRGVGKMINKNINYYNRFKSAQQDDTLSRAFVHVFFTRPDCYICSNDVLTKQCSTDPITLYSWRKRRALVKQLIKGNGSGHHFNLFLSNRVRSFSLTDKGVSQENYGTSNDGYSIKFPKKIDTEIGGTFDVSFMETRDLDVLNLHNVWMNYGVNVYTGKWAPKMRYCYQRRIDYACACYVIVTAEDFETILYWTKYYGVFPISIPFSSLSWEAGELITPDKMERVTIQYGYSWKEDFNPGGITDFNYNSFAGGHKKTTVSYSPSYNSEIGGAGYTWVGKPFVERMRYSVEKLDKTSLAALAYKLRFKYVG